MHGRFRIANDDYLYVLSTFVFDPIDWMAAYRRAFTANEQLAWLRYYQELGRRMGIADIPETLAAFRAFRERFEAERMVYADSNREVSGVTVDLVLAMYLPRRLFALGRPVAMALCSDRLIDGHRRKAAAGMAASRWCAAPCARAVGSSACFRSRNDCAASPGAATRPIRTATRSPVSACCAPTTETAGPPLS